MNISRLIPSLLLGVITATSVFCGPVAKAEPQPMMEGALVDLKEARHKLEKGLTDKGGHRDKAIELIDAAIAQIKEGMHFANHH